MTEWVPLIDITEVSMMEIISAQNTVLGRCIERFVNSLDDPDGTISAFQSYVE